MTRALTKSPKNMVGSKWTALRPVNKEKHFVVSGQHKSSDETDSEFQIRSILTERIQAVKLSVLQDVTIWKRGWE
jgi:tryptophan-rich hypothetical protein